MIPPPPRSTLFPYTTLFRSTIAHAARSRARQLTTDQIIAEIRAGIGSRRHNFGVTSRETLCDILDRKSTRLNSSHVEISYAVFCLKKKKNKINIRLQNTY